MISDSGCVEDYNLKEKINRYASTRETDGSTSFSRQRERIGAQDVKWSNGDFHTTIATAVSNGQIAVYDLNRVEVELARLHEHNRQVHKLAFNPHGGSLLLSGSQDGTVRLWDLRALSGEKSMMTCQSRSRYMGNSEGVRDVKWCPADGFEFAIGTDSGVIQHWDTRKSNSPLLKVNAHEKMCSSIDWHPGGKHLLSASADKRINVWDLSSPDRRLKPMWQIRLPHAVATAQWRPASWSSEGHRPGIWQCTQVAVSYSKRPLVHVWDLCRPSVSLLTLDTNGASSNDLLWQSQELLWTVDSLGTFTQTDMLHARKTIDKYGVNPFDMAPDGQIVFASMRTEPKRLSIEDVTRSLAQHERREITRNDKSRAFVSTSDGSNEEPNLLSSSFKNRRNKIPSSLRSGLSAGSTPPPIGIGGPVENLTYSLRDENRFQLHQVLAIGYVEGTFNADAFKYMARHYERPPPLPTASSACDLHQVLPNFCYHNGRIAEQADQYQLAQTWKILGFAVQHELTFRAERCRQRRLLGRSLKNKGSSEQDELHVGRGNDTPLSKLERDLSQVRPPEVSLISSNLATPVVRPAPEARVDFDSIDNIALSDDKGVNRPQSTKVIQVVPVQADRLSAPDTAKESDTSQRLGISQLSESPAPLDFYASKIADMDRQMAERRAAMGNYRAQPRSLLRFDDPFAVSGSLHRLPHLERQESNDSFQMPTGSTDGSNPKSSNMGSFESNVAFEEFGHTPEEYRDERSRIPSGRAGQAENAVIFDDEADLAPDKELSVPRAWPAPSESSDVPRHKSIFNTQSPSRPDERQSAIVHTEDIETDILQPAINLDLRKTKGEKQGDHFIEEDFFVEVENDEDELSNYPPWTATAILSELIKHYTENMFDPQFPTFLLLYLTPYFYVPFSREQARHIIQFYHDRLRSLGLHVQAAEIRNEAIESYPEIAEVSEFQISTGGAWCTSCSKPSRGSKPKFCERCRRFWDPCAVCHGKGPLTTKRPINQATFELPAAQFPHANDTLWSWCQDCGHGAHTGCRAALWALSECEGACPVPECPCDCAPGPRREEKHRQLLEEWKQNPSNIVTRDEWNAKESSAVQRTRGLVGMSALTSSNAEAARRMSQQAARGVPGPARVDSSASGPTSLSSTGRSASGSKKVRIVEPDANPGSDKQG